MNAKITLFLTALLIFICCIGAASAADDINDTLTTDNDVVNVEQASDDVDLEDDSSEDTILEVNNDEDVLEANDPTVNNWAELASNAGASGSAKTIYLASGKTFTPTSQIVFGNSATIIGTPTSYISGTYSGIPFKNTNTALSITFKNVNFKDISCTMLMQMLTTGSAKTTLEGCTFTNVNASSSGHNSVIYNNQGTMDITDSTFSNCRAAFGVITNHNAASTTNVILNVKNSKFENNYGYTEPGAINNCGQLTVYNSTFVGNHAVWWAGAIHTHSNANTLINKSTFKSNTAGWNGGALFTYSVLKVYDSVFEDNNCSTNNGGGAIGAYNYGSQYNIIINNCNFTKNNNLNSAGRGGAIGVLNGGYLNVYYSNFISNYAVSGQAISAANQQIENGTGGQPYLAIIGNTFKNHIGTSDTVSISGVANAFANNVFINSPQTQYSFGSGNTYNSIIPSIKKLDLLSAINEEIVALPGTGTKIYVNVSSDYDPTDFMNNPNHDQDDGLSWDKPFTDKYYYGSQPGLQYAWQGIEDEGTIFIANGEYNRLPTNIAEKVGYTVTLEGYGDNVIFAFADGYNLDFGSDYVNYIPVNKSLPQVPTQMGKNLLTLTLTHKNIIFDCDVKVGSKNFAFVNCTFNKGFEITRDYSSEDVCTVSFENCTFANQLNTESIPDNVTVTVNGTQIYPKITDDSGSSSGNATVNGTNTTKNNDKTDSNTNKQTTTTATTKKVTKKATKITAKKATFKKSKKVKKYSIVLKSGKTLVKKVKVTLKVGKKTYKATTNSKGKAIFKINKLTKKGKYTAVIKFKGNKNFKATSKKVKITVKK